MKNNNIPELVKGILTVAILSTLLIACGKKNDQTLPVNAFTQSCAGPECQTISGFPFFSAQTRAYQQGQYYSNSAVMSVNWSFSGQNINGQGQGQQYNQYASPAMNYVGKVSAAGSVTVSGLLNLGFCPQVPAGTYNLTTQTVGQWSNGQISGLRMFISGSSITMTASLSQAQASEYSYGYGYQSGVSNSRIYGNLIIEQVNGYYCQGAQFYLN
ncbi:MAG: hypothetical protein AABY53_06890 [Bdellovibrionota bacterium]